MENLFGTSKKKKRKNNGMKRPDIWRTDRKQERKEGRKTKRVRERESERASERASEHPPPSSPLKANQFSLFFKIQIFSFTLKDSTSRIWSELFNFRPSRNKFLRLSTECENIVASPAFTASSNLNSEFSIFIFWAFSVSTPSVGGHRMFKISSGQSACSRIGEELSSRTLIYPQ